MRKSLLISLLVIVAVASDCSNGKSKDTGNPGSQRANQGVAKLTFKEYEHNFGKVAEGEKVSHQFTFENKGTANLVLASAVTTCGCTVPKYDTKPIPPGGTGNLEVVFNTSGRNGMQTKTITVKSNASNPVVLLKITAEVVTNDK